MAKNSSLPFIQTLESSIKLILSSLNYNNDSTEMILETDKLTVASNDVVYSKDNSNEAKHTKCRQDLLNSIKEYSLKPSNDDDNW